SRVQPIAGCATPDAQWRPGDLLCRALAKSANGDAGAAVPGIDDSRRIHSADLVRQSRGIDPGPSTAPYRRNGHTAGARRIAMANSEAAMERMSSPGLGRRRAWNGGRVCGLARIAVASTRALSSGCGPSRWPCTWFYAGPCSFDEHTVRYAARLEHQ